MRTINRLTLGIAILATAACTDNPVSPAVDRSGQIRLPSLDIFPTYAPDSMSADIIVTPTGGTFVLGVHSIVFPANSICDPSSSYGESEWDAPCVAADTNLNFHVELRRDSTGRSWMDFSPSVRFVPSDDAAQWVVIFMNTRANSEAVAEEMPTILWSSAIGVEGIDESDSDATLLTHQIPETGIVYRRIKHFSGYQVGLGRGDESVIEDVIEGLDISLSVKP